MNINDFAQAVKCGIENVDVLKFLSATSGSGGKDVIVSYPWQLSTTAFTQQDVDLGDTYQLETNQEVIMLYGSYTTNFLDDPGTTFEGWRSYLNNLLIVNKWENASLLGPTPRFPRETNPQYRRQTSFTLATWATINYMAYLNPALFKESHFIMGGTYPIFRKIGPGGKLFLGVRVLGTQPLNGTALVSHTGTLWGINLQKG